MDNVEKWPNILKTSYGVNTNIFRYQTSNLQNFILDFGFHERKKGGKSKYVTKFKLLLHSVSSLIPWKTKLLIRQLAEYPQSTIYTLLEELSDCYDYILRLTEFADLLGTAFLITLKLFLFFQQFFTGAM